MPIRLIDAVSEPDPVAFPATFKIKLRVKAGSFDPAIKARAHFTITSIIGLEFNRPTGNVTEFDGLPFDVAAGGKETETSENAITVVSPGVVPLRFQVVVEVMELDGSLLPTGAPSTLPVQIRVSQ